MRRAKEEPGLAEVKAVLMQLQRLDATAEEDAGGTNSRQTASEARQATRACSASQADIRIFHRKHAQISEAEVNARSKRRIAAGLFSAGTLIAGAVILFATGTVNLPKSSKIDALKADLAPPVQDRDEVALLSEAQQLLNEGDVVLTRAHLLRGEPERRADVALMLAQSYDPNYLQSLPKMNGLPDRSEAARWYQKWYELASQSGLSMDRERLQRIINAMR